MKEIEYRLYYIDRRNKIEQSNKIALAGGKPKILIPKRRVLDHSQNEIESKEDAQISEKIMRAFGERQHGK